MSASLIIGGGFAGLAAGVELAAQGLTPILLEGRAHLGGRAYSFTDAGSGELVDNGQHALMGCYRHTLAFLDRIGAGHRLVRQANMRVAMAHPSGRGGVIAGAPLPSPLHMVGGVLGYRLLSRREQLRALWAGLAIRRMYERGHQRLTAQTVAALLTDLGQSANAQAAFWNPVAIATLNESPARAAALPFAAVLARAFFGSRDDAQFVLPGCDLSALYTEDARRFIEARGGAVHVRAQVAELELDADRVAAVRLRDGRRIAAGACIAAVPPAALATLLPPAVRDTAFAGLDRFASSPIVCAHLWLDRVVLDEPFLGCLGTATQWFFNRTALNGLDPRDGQRLGAVISAGRELVDWPVERIGAQVAADLRAVLPAARAATVRRCIVVKEKAATISCTPAAERARPGAETPLRNLLLAGDWTATGLPPTIEGAVQSGQRAAQLLAAHRPGHHASSQGASLCDSPFTS